MSVLSINAEDTAPVPAKMSATEVMSGHCSSTTFVINGNSLYLLPKYRRLLMDDVRYVRACSNSALLVGIRLKIVSLPRSHNLLQCCAKTAYLLRSEEVLTSLKRFQGRGKDLSTPLKMAGGRLRFAMDKWDNSTRPHCRTYACKVVEAMASSMAALHSVSIRSAISSGVASWPSRS